MDDAGERVELGDGIRATCSGKIVSAVAEAPKAESAKADLSSLSAMLKNKWKSGETSGAAAKTEARAGQIRSFRITRLDAAAKKIELELA
jgi:small subunit ribosomal protein S1